MSATLTEFRLSPEIILSREDHNTLLRLAMAGTGHSAIDSDALLYELERATIVGRNLLSPDIVRMGSVVTYRTGEDARTVRLVYPGKADISQGTVSVLTPIGTALLGLRTGQSISWRTRDERRQALTVLRVTQPAIDDPDPPIAA